jgi:hypothetical protein
VHYAPFLAFFPRRVFTSSQTVKKLHTASLHSLYRWRTPHFSCCILMIMAVVLPRPVSSNALVGVGATNTQRPLQNLGYKCSYDSCQRLRWSEIQPPMWFYSWFSPISHVDLCVLGPVCSLPDVTAQCWLHGSVSQHRLPTPSEDRLLGSVNLT